MSDFGEKQIVERTGAYGMAKVREISVREYGHRPSWSMFSKGMAELEFSRHVDGGWMQVKLAERRDAERTKPRDKGTEKVTYMTLSEETAQELYKALREWFEPSPGSVEDPPCPHGFGDDVVCLQCHPERRETAKLPGFQNGEGMDAGAWLPVEDEEGYPLVECEACRNTTLDENTDVCRNPACPTNDIVRESIAMLEADEQGG